VIAIVSHMPFITRKRSSKFH